MTRGRSVPIDTTRGWAYPPRTDLDVLRADVVSSHFFKTALYTAFVTPYERPTVSLMSRWDAAARVPPPSDPKQRQVVEKLAEYRVRNGEEFVQMVRSKNSGDPLYHFLSKGPEDPVFKYYTQQIEVHTQTATKTTLTEVLPPPPRGVSRQERTTNTNPQKDIIDLPPGLIPSLTRAANGANGKYTPIHKDDIPPALARAEAIANALKNGINDELTDPESTSEYLSDRLKRFAEDLNDGGRARLKQRDKQRWESYEVIEDRKRDELERIKHGQPGGGVKKTWPARAGGGAHPNHGKRKEFAAGPERPGLGVARLESETKPPDDQYEAFRKKRSGTYHALIDAGRGK